MVIFLILIGTNIDDKENSGFIKELSLNGSLRIRLFKDVDNAINHMTFIEFQETKVIVSYELYAQFIKKFKENAINMCIIPKIIMLTDKKDKFIEDNKNYQSVDNKFYNFGGIINSLNEINKFLIIEPKISNILEEVQLTSEFIDKKEKLILPLSYLSLIDDITNDDIEKYNSFLYTTYSKENEEIKNLLGSVDSIPSIPLEILSKYYSRLYTAKTDFYKDINKAFKLNQMEKHLPFIRVLYEGIKIKSLPLASNYMLYKGLKMPNEEILKIKNNMTKKIKDLPSSILFSKTFLSFTKDKRISDYFLSLENKNENLSKVLLILDKEDNIDLNFKLFNHCDLEKISFFPNEREILFFPFTSFEIKEIKEINQGNEKLYEMKLSLIDRYIKEIYDDKNIIINENIIPDNEFKYQLSESGLIKKESLQNITIKQICYFFKEKFKNNFKEKAIHKNNIIIGEINIKKEDINKDIQIINSYENVQRQKRYSSDDKEFENEKEIMENIEIKINEKRIEFSYTYKFEKEGKYSIKYSFKNKLTKTNHMFYECENIISLDLSDFDTENVTNMCYMFANCGALNLNLSNFNTENVTNMRNMFWNCYYLTNLDLSSFNTQKVKDMQGIFCRCTRLINLNLSSFNTQNITSMINMFNCCCSLKYLNLSSFNTENVKDMAVMFDYCKSLISLDLSNFNTQNVKNMYGMFAHCESLISLDLRNFNIQNDTFADLMFVECKSLKKKNIIVKDDRIINKNNYIN